MIGGRGLALGACMLLSGCATVQGGLNPLVGQPIDAAIAKYGYPAAERQVAGRHLYTWQTATPAFGPAPCQLDIEADANGQIVNWQTRGSNIACEQFAR